jgi:hypothetical protein
LLGGIAALGNFGAVIAVPRAAFLDDFEVAAEVDDLAGFGDAFAENMISKAATRKGGASLFLTTFTFTWLPTTLPSLSFRAAPLLRMSRRTEA